MIKRIAFAVVALVLFAVTFGGAISLMIVVGRAAWGWLFLLVPALAVAAIILVRIAARLLGRALDG